MPYVNGTLLFEPSYHSSSNDRLEGSHPCSFVTAKSSCSRQLATSLIVPPLVGTIVEQRASLGLQFSKASSDVSSMVKQSLCHYRCLNFSSDCYAWLCHSHQPLPHPAIRKHKFPSKSGCRSKAASVLAKSNSRPALGLKVYDKTELIGA
jgi:hypothetical protein